MKKIAYILAIIIAIWIIGNEYVLHLAPNSLFVPEGMARSKQVDPSAFPIGYQTDFVANKAGQKIEMLWIPNFNSKEVVLYFPGNAGRIPEVLAEASKNANVLSPEYPGYSQSEGAPTEENFDETADLAVKYIQDKGYDLSHTTILGHSLGGAAAVYAAAKYPDVERLITVNTFASVYSLCWPKYYILCVFTSNYFNSAKLAAQISAPAHIYHDQNDDVIPYSQAPILFNAVKSADKKFDTLPGNHSTFDARTVLK